MVEFPQNDPNIGKIEIFQVHFPYLGHFLYNL